MAIRIIVGLILLLAIVGGLAPDMIPGEAVPILLVVLGIAYAAMAIDAEDATATLVVILAVGAAAGANVLSAVPAIGAPLDAILDHASIALYSSAIAVFVTRAINRLKGL